MTLVVEPLMMMEAPSRSSGRAFWTVNSTPLTLVLNVSSKCFSVMVPRAANSAVPALAKTMSRASAFCFTTS